ncbi:hypothetical protein DUNSADRAFT_11735 [Dunaliella salina]|uniref:Encoded protein n=1 Tax=Dunaliella salina TaxID=3046 RepID=A0ABQ7GCT3_DUNSA|nr:hypothetical protein DUNSADRAFT_11735 [Dunaliella salina]|eukprot:KAF5832404.1 hypothetical protein DUNSADRAFT_11735 [Dunaliella salina]
MHAWTPHPCTFASGSECRKPTATRFTVESGHAQLRALRKPVRCEGVCSTSSKAVRTQTDQFTSSASCAEGYAHTNPPQQVLRPTTTVLPQQVQAARRAMLIAPFTAAMCLSSTSPASALSLKGAPCPGLNGYKLSKCLQEARREQEQKEQEEGLPSPSSRAEPAGRLVTLPSGLSVLDCLLGPLLVQGRDIHSSPMCFVDLSVTSAWSRLIA